MNHPPEMRYYEREKRINDAIALEVPDRVPIMSLFGFFPAKYQGITCEEAMYDREKMMAAWRDTIMEFPVDAHENPFFYLHFGPLVEALDFRQLKWPGHGVSPMHGYQFVEAEHMRSEEYDEFLYDPTDFIVRKYWPRVFGAFRSLEGLSPFREIISYYMGFGHFSEFGSPEVTQALAALARASEAAGKMIAGGIAYEREMKGLGFPMQLGSTTQAPFDTIADFFRGTKGSMLDMFRRPEKLMEATEKIYPVMLRMGLSAGKRRIKRVFIPIHKGLDGFMSEEQFKTFFWPGLRRLIHDLADADLNPVVLWEGDCTSRLEIIGDIPKAKAVYWFEGTDIFRAKEVLGDRVCLRGNVPLSMMCTGNADDVKDYCRKLIDRVGQNGGYIMDCSTVVDDAKPENLKAMIDFTKAYGRYD